MVLVTRNLRRSNEGLEVGMEGVEGHKTLRLRN